MDVERVRKYVGKAFILAAGLGLILALAGCTKRQPTPPQLAPQPRPTRTVPAPVAKPEPEAAQKAVAQYLTALAAQDYAAAYALLSADSQKRHPEAVFTKDAKAGQVVYDLTGAKVSSATGQTAQVFVPLQQEEEAGGRIFSVVKEDGKWKVIYLSGKPFFPYAE